MQGKIDLKRELEGFRARRGEFTMIDVPPQRYLAVDGAGDPNAAPEYAAALAALYPVAYALKFASRSAFGRDYVVPPLEGLWWAEDMTSFTTARDKGRWSWTMMVMIPEWVSDALVVDVIDRARAEGAPGRFDDIRIMPLQESLCVQTLHVGPFDDEGPVLTRMHDVFIPSKGLVMTGRHHEIYLSDPRRTAPERLRTILRQPVERA